MKRILVADDEKDILMILEIVLSQEGYNVLTASDGKEALEVGLREKPDLVILDVVMPKASGWDVCRTLKSNPTTGEIPVVLFSARAQEQDLQKGREAGADDIILKPFDLSDLVKRVGSLATRTSCE